MNSNNYGTLYWSYLHLLLPFLNQLALSISPQYQYCLRCYFQNHSVQKYPLNYPLNHELL